MRTHPELEVPEVVGRHVHTDPDRLAGLVPPDDDSGGKLSSPLPLPGPSLVPGVPTHPTPAAVLVLVSVVTSTVGLRRDKCNVKLSVTDVKVPPCHCSKSVWRSQTSKLTSWREARSVSRERLHNGPDVQIL